jgi:ubiquinone/menaquinone biosynthesis C-methylase UbiE
MITMERLFWELYSQCYDSVTHLYSYQEMQSDIASRLPEIDNLEILDVCCGTGNAVPILEKKNKLFNYTGIDFSKHMLRRAESKYGKILNVNFFQKNINTVLPFPDNSFNILLCINALYVLDDHTFLIKEFSRVVKKGGMIIVSTPIKKPKIIKHISFHIKNKSFLSLFLKVIPLILLLLFNLIIVKKGERKDYKFFTKDELISLLHSDDIHLTYAEQNWLIVKKNN